MTLKWYRFHQNNSFGVFHGPAQNVHIQAENTDQACEIALEHGIYFNGVAAGIDCPCCGDRWYRPWEDSTDQPENYGEPVVNDEFNLVIPMKVDNV